MQQLTPKQKRDLLRLGEIADNGASGIVRVISKLEDDMDAEIGSLKEEIGGDIEKVAKRASEALAVAKETAKQEGKPGDPGEKGENGDDYILTEEDKNDIARKIRVPVVEKIIEKRTETIIREQPIVTEKQIPIALHTSPQEVRDLLELLLDDERLDARAIKNLEEAIRAYLTLNPQNPMLHPVALGNLPDVDVAGAATDQVLAWNGTYWHPKTITVAPSGSIIEATDSGDHQNFTLASALTTSAYFVSMNGGMYLQSDPSFPFSITSLTLTFTSPLPSDLSSLPINVICI